MQKRENLENMAFLQKPARRSFHKNTLLSLLRPRFEPPLHPISHFSLLPFLFFLRHYLSSPAAAFVNRSPSSSSRRPPIPSVLLHPSASRSSSVPAQRAPLRPAWAKGGGRGGRGGHRRRRSFAPDPAPPPRHHRLWVKDLLCAT